MQRYNIFRQVHKGILCSLLETSLLLQQTDFSSNVEEENMLVKLSVLAEMINQQYQCEQRLLLPVVTKYDPSLASALTATQQAEQSAGQQLNAMLDCFKNAVNDQDKETIGLRIQQLFNDFLCVKMKGMEYRESVANPVLWTLYNDETLAAISLRVGKGLSPELIVHFNRCMMRALNNAEIIAWMLRVKNYAPDSYFEQLLQLASNELPPKRWQLVQEALTDGIMVQ
jgi:hypothetical protein